MRRTIAVLAVLVTLRAEVGTAGAAAVAPPSPPPSFSTGVQSLTIPPPPFGPVSHDVQILGSQAVTEAPSETAALGAPSYYHFDFASASFLATYNIEAYGATNANFSEYVEVLFSVFSSQSPIDAAFNFGGTLSGSCGGQNSNYLQPNMAVFCLCICAGIYRAKYAGPASRNNVQ